MMRGRELGPSGLEAHLNHAPLPVPSPELAKLLDAFDNAIMDYNYGEGRGDIAAARSAIELSFATLTEEIKRLKTEATATSFLVTATEKSTARTESPASDPLVAPVRLPFQKAITVLMRDDDGVKQAEADLAAIADGTSTVFRHAPPDNYFYQLRLAAAKDLTLLDKIAVFYVGADDVIREVVIGPECEDEGMWPAGFQNSAWILEAATRQARWDRKSPEYKELHRVPMIGEQDKERAALLSENERLRATALTPEEWEAVDFQLCRTIGSPDLVEPFRDKLQGIRDKIRARALSGGVV